MELKCRNETTENGRVGVMEMQIYEGKMTRIMEWNGREMNE